MAKKVTMQQIADYLSVSKYVVSKALAGKVGVSTYTRDKVFEAASMLGYFTQTNGKTEKMKLKVEKGNQTILVLMPNVRYQTKESSYWGKIVQGITNATEKKGLGIVIFTETNVNYLSSVLNLDAFIGVISVGLVSTPLLLEIQRKNIPLVMVDHEDALLTCDTIFNNNFDSSARLANHLIGLGHRSIQFIGDIHYSRSFYDRWMGIRSSLEENKLPVKFDEELCSFEYTNIEGSFKDWLDRQSTKTLPTAFVCANDEIATRVIKSLMEKGVNVPEDISVTGFDNKEVSYQTAPTLTTVNVAKEELGKRSVKMLIHRLNEKDAPFEKLLLSGTNILRESTSSPAK
jgi:LacI family transcriptional regulator